MVAGAAVVGFRRWLHRARFLALLEDAPDVSRYAVTRLGRQRPYQARLLYPVAREERLRDAARLHHGAFRARLREESLAALEREAFAGDAVWTGGTDPLLDALRGGGRFYWTAAYCRMCNDAACRRGSTQQARCQRLAEDIGAWDEVEIRDIFHLYRQGGESLEACYRRILEMHDLPDIIEAARPRWPDAFAPCSGGSA